MIKSEASSVALISPDNNLGRYLDQIKKFPMLTSEDEYKLAKDWLDKNNTKAAHKLVTSHLRLVAKIAMGYRGYGLPVADLIAEGNLIKLGQRLAYGQVNMSSEKNPDSIVCHVTSTYSIPPKN